MCIFCILVVLHSVVVYAGKPVVVPGDISVVIDCGHLMNTMPDSNFCISWLKNGNPILTNSSCINISVDMQYLTISSDFCKPGPPIICYSYNSFLTDTVHECKVSHTIQLEVDGETLNQTNAGKEFYLGFSTITIQSIVELKSIHQSYG